MKTDAQPARGMTAIGDLILGYRGAKVLFTAANLDLFTRLGDRAVPGEKFSRSLRLDPRAAVPFFDSLCALGFLEKTGGCYRNSALSREFLSKQSPRYLGDNLKYQDNLWPAWANLQDVLRVGRPKKALGELLGSRGVFGRDYIRAMDNIAARPARELAEKVECSPNGRLLDVGAGPGTYAVALLRRNPGMTATLFDLPSTLKHTRALINRQPLSLRRRVSFMPGNYLKSTFGTGTADVLLLSHVTHDEGEEENLLILAKAKQALRPGGKVIIHDFMVYPEGTAPLFSVLFSVHLLVYTRHGRVYSEAEYTRWLNKVGFHVSSKLEIAPGAPNATRALVADLR